MRPSFPVCMLALVAVLMTAGCDSPKEREAKYVEHGKALYDSGDLAKAALEFKNALQINPAGVDAQYYLGLIAEKNHDLASAAVAFQRAAQEDPHHFQANLKAGQLALMGGDVDGATNYGTQLIAIAPDKTDGHTMLAAADLIRGKVPQAETEANAALRIDQNNADALIVLASVRARSSQYVQALATIEQGLQAHPNSAELLTVKLKLLFDQKRTTDVIAVLRQLHQVEPGNPNYVIDLANQLAGNNQVDEAGKVFQDALAGDKTSDTLISAYAGFLITRRSLDVAIREIKSLAEQSGQTKYIFLLEQLYLTAGKAAEATKLVEDVRDHGKTSSEQVQAKVELARIAVFKGNDKDGLDQVNAVLTEDPSNESAFLLRGSIMLKESKYDNAIADARSVLNGNPNSIPALTVLSKAYVASGENDLAIESLRSLLKIAPANVEARLQLASLLAGKSPEDTLENLDAVIALRPDAVELKIQKAEYLIQTGSPDKAELIAQDLVKDPKMSAVGHTLLGQAALARTDYATAISELNLAQAQGQPFKEIGPSLVTAYVKAGKTVEAEKILTDRISKDANDADTRVLLALLYAQDRKFDEAGTLLNQALAIRPDDVDAYLRLIQVLTQQDKMQDAVALSAKAAAKFPNDRNVLLSAAVTYDEHGDFALAQSTYENILAKWPTDTVAANNLAALIADAWPKDSKQLDHARQLAETFRNSTEPMLLDTLGWVLVRQGQFDDATILLQKATSMMPDNQQMQFHYGVALRSKGLTAKAKEALTNALAGDPKYRGLDEARQAAAALN